MKIGAVSFLVGLPFTYPIQAKSVPYAGELDLQVPEVLNERWREGDYDAIFSSSVLSLEKEHPPHYGIGVFGCVESVRLYARCPLERIQHVGVTEQSATSKELLRVLATHFWKSNPDLLPLDRTDTSPYDAILLIGDEALLTPSLPGRETYDLGELWTKETNLPFVFATLQCRNDSPFVSSLFEEALTYSEEHKQEVIEEATKRSSLPPSMIESYLQRFHYRLTPKMREGLFTFKRYRDALLTSSA